MNKDSNLKGSAKRAVGGGKTAVDFMANGLVRATERAIALVVVDGRTRYSVAYMFV